MVHLGPDFGRESSGRANKPNFERARAALVRMEEAVSRRGPSGLTEKEIAELVVKYCGRANIPEDWPVVRIDEPGLPERSSHAGLAL